MADLTPDIETVENSRMSPIRAPMENIGDITTATPTPDVQSSTVIKIERAEEAYKAYEGHDQEKPARAEVWGWYLYGFCSYFVHEVMIPIVFPLIISQIMSLPPDPVQGWDRSSSGLVCGQKEMKLYRRLTYRSITVFHFTKFSPLHWTSISWAIGLAVAAPLLGSISIHLDHGQHQPLIAAAAIATGALFCLPAGFFKTVWIFIPYISAIIAAHTVARTCHTRHLGLMVNGFTGPTIHESQFPIRRAVSGWLSIYATIAGCAGSAIISAFTYHMLRESSDQEFLSLWIVSIFSGLNWLVGTLHAFTSADRTREINVDPFQSKIHPFAAFKFPHAIGSLAGVFLSSFTTMCIFDGGVLFLVGQLCLKPMFLLAFWLIYFIFPMFSLPLLQPLQHLIKADAVKMQILGFLLAAATTGAGLYFREINWQTHIVLFFAAIQGTSAGLLHAFGRVLLLDCSPSGNEGAFSIWFSWTKALGAFVGFTVASVSQGKIGTCFGIAFCTAMMGVVLLIFSNISDFGGAVAAGHVVRGDSEKAGSPSVPARGRDVVVQTMGGN